MTKTIILGTPTEHTIKKIKFTHSLQNSGVWCTAVDDASMYEYVELISLGYDLGDFDIMFAYDSNNNRANGVLYKGKWNDGIA
jgi:hypothetical protein